jgi:3-deoxy-manno-octulosonate cytidylyltransferase (CMP-KDO synthetase)
VNTTALVPAFTVLIPARLASTRLPNKPLADIAGKPMIVRVAERAAQVRQLPGVSPTTAVVVAADDPSIVQACQAHGVRALLTRTDHPSGSDRLAEACTLLGLPDEAIVVNVQGDEPLLPPVLIAQIALMLQQRPQASMSTAAHAIDDAAEFANRNVVKVVCDAQGHALYFSRSPIPHSRDGGSYPASHGAQPALRHVGMYAYRTGFLKQFPSLPPAPLEQLEALEQLRALWHGHRIAVHVTQHAPGPGVDTPADLARVRQLFATQVRDNPSLRTSSD